MPDYINEEVFDASKFPEIIKELYTLKENTAHTSVYFKPEIIISYLKSHSIKTEWVNSNPALVKLMTSNVFATARTELFFESNRNNMIYIRSYEAYIRELFFKF